ncbi:MAG: hypothetical protein HOH20_08575 [Rhodospirillaceae bacterium]|jgi:hypothetical protein|nr:hypothetical protein [Rhodospirillaceae bacterium]MBT5241352.1 hypothetical protein [Rhodospirillaceae bacterium]MBT5566544.1 hypothetical protein [Rhodospirillaceae bacterium]MBT6089615.1 hypothetical protein [Rhodospirillaceae bacterium]
MDSLYVLPLNIMPLETTALHGARLIKNHRLEGVIELFSEENTGSGQIRVDDLPDHFQWKEGMAHPDLQILIRLAPLPSYDVYSLRRSLRDLGIALGDDSSLQLSEGKNKELTAYMSSFTLPLIKQIYGGDDLEVTNFKDLVGLFKDPDVKKAIGKLKTMAEKLNIQLDQIPRFLEDYGDIFLSLSYYRNCLDRLQPLLENFVQSMNDIKKNYKIKQDKTLLSEAAKIEKLMVGLVEFLQRLFQDFDNQTQDLWDNLSAERFEQVKKLISDYHTTIGGVLCGLTVKMNAWVSRYPNPRTGSPIGKGEFIMTDMRQGAATIREMATNHAR